MTETPNTTDDESTIRIPGELRGQIRERMDGTDFDSVDAYVRFVLEAVVSGPDADPDERDERAHESEIQERLEDLGYR